MGTKYSHEFISVLGRNIDKKILFHGTESMCMFDLLATTTKLQNY